MNRQQWAQVRSRSRSWALQLLYAWELAGDGPPLEDAPRSLMHRRMSQRYRPYVERLLEAVGRELAAIDEVIERHAPNWRLDRMQVIDRNILRLGIVELRLFDDVPPVVAIHEALKLAARYGSAESTRFLNGVLDAVRRADEAAAATAEA